MHTHRSEVTSKNGLKAAHYYSATVLQQSLGDVFTLRKYGGDNGIQLAQNYHSMFIDDKDSSSRLKQQSCYLIRQIIPVVRTWEKSSESQWATGVSGNMYYSHGITVVIAISATLVIIWLIGCFLWNCLCCECCCDFKNKIYRNPIRARPSIISTHRRSIFSLKKKQQDHRPEMKTVEQTAVTNQFMENEISRI